MAVDRQTLLEEADRAARKGDLRRCVLCYQELVDHFPDDRALLQKLGDAQARAGEEEAGRSSLVRLAELYRDDGDRSRSLALLRRASRLGTPDGKILAQLGGWLLAGGVFGDAKDPLYQAADLFEKEGDLHGACGIYRQLLAAGPGENRAREALAALCDQLEPGAQRAEVLYELAKASHRCADSAGATAFALRALCDDPDGLLEQPTCRSGLRDICRAGQEIDPGGEFELNAPAQACWTLLRAEVLIPEGEGERWIKPLAEIGDDPEASARTRIQAARLLLEAGDTAGAARIGIQLSEGISGADPLNPACMDLLSAVVSRDPGQQEAMHRLGELSPELGEPETVTSSPEVDSAPRAHPALSPTARARLVEAEAMLGHGMPNQALESLAALSDADREVPEVAKLCLAAEEQLTAQVTSAPEPEPRESQAAPQPGGVEHDEWVISFDEESETAPQPMPEEGAPPAVLAPEPANPPPAPSSPPEPRVPVPSTPAPPPVEASPAVPVEPPTAEQEADGPQEPGIDQLQQRLVAAIDDDDAETRYQMAIGLLEMGLDEQAIPMLEELAGAGERALDAGLYLLRHRVQEKDLSAGLFVGERALASSASSAETAEKRIQLLALVVQLSHQLGEHERGNAHLSELRQIGPDHPLLQRLEAWISAK